MIIFFHFIVLITKYIVTTLSKSLSSKKYEPEGESESACEKEFFPAFSHEVLSDSDCFYRDGQIKFFPPVYVQRYEAVFSILQELQRRNPIRKVVDFGCSELGFFLYLKGLPTVEEILEVDIDESILIRYANKAAPINADYFLCKRAKPCNVLLFAGNIADFDDHLMGTDVVVAIEVIEHMTPDDLQRMPHNIFHEIQPSLAIFTTPNSDFNVLFPSLTGFRHPDHKFEWSRREFYTWTQDIIKIYPSYSVRFYGIGPGPEGTENLGCCSQMAVFKKHVEQNGELHTSMAKGVHKYKLIREYEYPFYVDTRTKEEKVIDEVLYRIKFSMNNKNNISSDGYCLEVLLTDLMFYVNTLCSTVEELKTILIEHGFVIDERDGEDILVYPEILEDSELDHREFSMEHDTVNIESEFSDEENWDLEEEDGKFINCQMYDTSPEDEIANFLTARSFPNSRETSVCMNPKSAYEFEDIINPECIEIIGDEIFMEKSHDRTLITDSLKKKLSVPYFGSGTVDRCRTVDY